MNNLPLNIDYSGKVVVVTGAGGLICGAMVAAFAKSGAKVAALDLNEDAVKKLAAELKAEGYICEGYKANVLEREVLEEVHQQVLKDLPTKATHYVDGMNWAVIICFCIIPMLAWIAPLIAMKGYELDGKRIKEIQAITGARKSYIAAGHTLEEAMEAYKTVEDVESKKIA